MNKLVLMMMGAGVIFGACAENIAYLATTGDDATGTVNNEWRPYKSLQTAIDALGAEGGTVRVAHGTYSLTSSTAPEEYQSDNYLAGNSCVLITAPVQVVGATGNPADVVFKRDASVASARVFMLNHAEAKLKYVTVQDGKFTDSKMRNGGNVLIAYEGGTVEDCILKNGNAGKENSTSVGGGNIALMAGRCSRCFITEGKLSHYRPIGLNVMAAGSSVVENCLITKGYCTKAHEAAADEGAVALKDSARLVNCTVAGNKANRFSGVNILSSAARAINCVIFGNTVTYESNGRDQTADVSANGVSKNAENRNCYVNCGTDLDTSKYEQLNDTCFTVSALDFADTADVLWVWALDDTSVCRDAGSSYAESGALSETDYAGNDRVLGLGVDVGCYELPASFRVAMTASATRLLLGGDSTVTFWVVADDATGEVSYTWNFGDGSEPLVTTSTEVTHEYTQIGTFTVSVTGICEAGAYTRTLAEPVIVTNFAVTFARSTGIAITNDVITFTAKTTVTDPVIYTWTFGDGTVETTSEKEVSHAYAAGGAYKVAVVADGGMAGMIDYAFEDDLLVVCADMYVGYSGSQATFPYATKESCALNLDAVMSYLTDGVTVHMAPGTYTQSGVYIISNAVTIVGDTDNPADVVVNNTISGKIDRGNFLVRNAGAVIANLTMKGGYADGTNGGGISRAGNLDLVSGTVTNCILTGGFADRAGGEVGGARVRAGLLSHCIIEDAKGGNRASAIFIWQSGGRVDNCLFRKSRNAFVKTTNTELVGVRVEGGEMVNCTMADLWLLHTDGKTDYSQLSKNGVPLAVGKDGRVINCVFADYRFTNNEDTPENCSGIKENCINCAFDSGTKPNESCLIGTTEMFFVDYANGDLMPNGLLKHAGSNAAAGFTAFDRDLAGNPRLYREIDIGCYEAQPTKGFSIILR